MQVNFIVGMSRAGTRWVAKCLNEHPRAAVFGETCFWGRKYVAPQADGRYDAAGFTRLVNILKEAPKATLARQDAELPELGCLKNITVQSYPRLVEEAFEGCGPGMTPGEAFVRLAEAIASKEGKSVAIEKTPHHINWIDRILGAMPDAKFVVMMRMPYEFMLSYKHQQGRGGSRGRKLFKRLYHPLACAIIWRAYVQAAMDARDRYPEKVLLVRFEEMVQHPEENLGKIQTFLSLAPMELADKVPSKNSSFQGDARPRLGAADIFWMNLVAKRTIQRVGETPRPVPAAPLPILWSFLRTPTWAIRNLCSMYGKTNSLLPYLWRWIAPARSRQE